MFNQRYKVYCNIEYTMLVESLSRSLIFVAFYFIFRDARSSCLIICTHIQQTFLTRLLCDVFICKTQETYIKIGVGWNNLIVSIEAAKNVPRTPVYYVNLYFIRKVLIRRRILITTTPCISLPRCAPHQKRYHNKCGINICYVCRHGDE